VLLVGNKSENNLLRTEMDIRERLIKLRAAGTIDKDRFKLSVYDFSKQEHRDYCTNKLNIRESDLLFLGITDLNEKGIPTRILWRTKVDDPDRAMEALLKEL